MSDRYSPSDSSVLSSGHRGPEVDAVLFDYGQVLSLGPNAAAWERLRSIIGGDPAVFQTAYWNSRHDYDRGTLNGEAYWNGVARFAGHPGLSDKELDKLSEADVDLWTDLNEPMLAFAMTLQQRGLRIGILSNIGDRMETGIRERFRWIADFPHCTWSHRLNMAKPETAIYKHAAEALGSPPERILFIDDREENVDGARRAGMLAIQYTTHEAFIDDLRALGLGNFL